MTEQLKNCPFCGQEPKTWKCSDGRIAVDCTTPTCLMYQEGGVYIEYWNTRPLEDALQEELKDIQGALNVVQNLDVIHMKQIDALQHKLDIAMEALKAYAEIEKHTYRTISQEALKELEEKCPF